MAEWKDKNVMLTGGAKGIGEEIVKMLITEDVKYIALLDEDEMNALSIQEQANIMYNKDIVYFHKCDVSVEEQIAAVFKAVLQECGHVDVLINNAAICKEKETMFRKTIEVNYTAVVSMSMKALDIMRKDKGGKGGTIINIASTTALIHVPFCPVYSGTKAAVLKFSLNIGSDDYYKRTAVRIIAICFGSTNTTIVEASEFFDEIYDGTSAELVTAYPQQTTEAAARGVCEAFKKGNSGSTWLVDSGNTKDITEAVTKAYNVLADAI